jgi:hypothetical protein
VATCSGLSITATRASPAPHRVLELLARKCEFKCIAIITLEIVSAARESLIGTWEVCFGTNCRSFRPLSCFGARFRQSLNGSILAGLFGVCPPCKSPVFRSSRNYRGSEMRQRRRRRKRDRFVDRSWSILNYRRQAKIFIVPFDGPMEMAAKCFFACQRVKAPGDY